MAPIESNRTGLEIAIIGMAGRFPGANNIRQFWENLENGIESISFFSENELIESGMDLKAIDSPNFVKACAAIEKPEFFDAFFFNYTPFEAELMDPQMRILHECVYEALETAGYGASTSTESIGLYIGASPNFYWEAAVSLSQMQGGSDTTEGFSKKLLNDKDFIATRISYTLDLKGPSFTMYTACSTSLVAVDLACRGILTGQCDIALAGGVTISWPPPNGYRHQEEMVFSPDGHTRTFDEKGKGCLFGQAAGIVVLKSLDEAVEDRDEIQCVIKGTAVNNDGKQKVGYTAPGPKGQVEVIKAAQYMARVEPTSINYIEAHGTATILGDPIEIKALTQAFNTGKKGFCAIGSVKSNLGHLDAAAGIASLIKTALALKHRKIPPSLHYENPNPKIDFKNSPFYVNTTLKEWKNDIYPLRAGVSSFGIGGTNAHVILEEWPGTSASVSQRVGDTAGAESREYQLLLLSAKTQTALEKMTGNLARYFKENTNISLADAAYTLQVGRKPYNYRRMTVCSNHREALQALENPQIGNVRTCLAKKEKKQIIFMFSGQGDQYVNMGWDLYQTQSIFRQEIDQGFEILESIMGPMRSLLYPPPQGAGHVESLTVSSGKENNENNLDQITYSGPIKFIFDYSMAKLLMSWGIEPRVMIGHSFGEYVAACLSGVFSFEDTLKLIIRRGKLMLQLPEGAMMGVPLSEKEAKSYLESNDELSLAAVNSPTFCIIAGPNQAINKFEKKLIEKGLECLQINVTRAGHSKMMEPILPQFEAFVSQLTLNKPQIPFISCVTAKEITVEEAVDPAYWAKHIRKTVRFADAINELVKNPDSIFIQVGCGRGLSLYASQHPGITPDHLVINLLRSSKDNVSDVFYLLNQIGELWLRGQTIDWRMFYREKKKSRISLPTYPFEIEQYRKYADHFKKNRSPKRGIYQLRKKKDVSDWFYVPSWERTVLQPGANNHEPPLRSCWLIFIDACDIGAGLIKKLAKDDRDLVIVSVKKGKKFAWKDNRNFVINPQQENDYELLFAQLEKMKQIPIRILHLWGLTRNKNYGKKSYSTILKNAKYSGFYSILNLAKAIGKREYKNVIRLEVVTDNMQEVNGLETVCPEKSLVLGPVNVIPQEYPNIVCRSIDVMLPDPGDLHEMHREKLVKQLLAEFKADSADTVIAYRGDYRWVLGFKPIRLDESLENSLPLREEGVYMITGGLGRIGLILAEYLAKRVRARLILTGRSKFPPRQEWDQWLSTTNKDNPICRKIRKLIEMENSGAKLLVCSANAVNLKEMKHVILRVEKQWGPINGVIHSAGTLSAKTLRVIEKMGINQCERQFRPKVDALPVLETLLKGKSLDFCMLMSSLASILGGLGHVAYSAANIFMDHYVYRYNRENPVPWISVNWEEWDTGNQGKRVSTSQVRAELAELAMNPPEGIMAFNRILSWGGASQVLNSSGDLQTRINKWIKLEPVRKDKEIDVPDSQYLHARPNLSTPYLEPSNQVERVIAGIWKKIFGFEEVGILDDFFELGGDSLRAMTVTFQIHKQLNVRVPIIEYFSRATIKAIAEYIEQSGKTGEFSSIEPAEKREYYPLSFAQKRLYFLNRLAPLSIAYNEFTVMKLEKIPGKHQLEKAFRELLERHESLRTSFIMLEGTPVQRIHNNHEVEFKIEYHEIQEGEREAIRNFVRPFDLSKTPLIRSGLIKLANGDYIWMIDSHHIAADGKSQTILTRDFISLSKGDQLESLRLQYKDFCQWQEHLLEGEDIKSQEDYWFSLYKGDIPTLNLPTDFKRPEVFTYAGAKFGFRLDKELVAGLKALSSVHEGTLYMNLLTVLNVLFYKYTGQDDIVIGSVIAGRPHADLENIVGMFVNSLALRNFPGGEKTYESFFKEVIHHSVKAFENQALPFEELVDRLDTKRDVSRNPLFDILLVGFSFQEDREKQKSPSGYKKLSLAGHKITTAKFDLVFYINDRAEDIDINLDYYTAIFKAETLRRLAIHFKNVIKTVTGDPAIKLKDIDITSEEEKKQILTEFNNLLKNNPFPNDKTLPGLFDEQTTRTPDHVALVGTGPEPASREMDSFLTRGAANYLSYNLLNKKSLQLAHLLRKKGIPGKTLVGIMMEPSLQLITGIIAILKTGCAFLPINPKDPGKRIRYMLEDTCTRVLITTTALFERVGKLGGWAGEIVFIDKESYCHLSPLPPATIPADSLAYIIYTSGSTGNPKGVPMTYTNLSPLFHWGYDQLGIHSHDRAMQNLSYYFDWGVWEIFIILTCGASLYVVPREFFLKPKECYDFILRNGITALCATPTQYQYLVDVEKKPLALKYLFLGAEKLTVDLTRRSIKSVVKDCRVFNMYGPTEAAILSAGLEILQDRLTRYQELTSVPIGKALGNAVLFILDRDMHWCPIGVVGELYIGGDGVAAGYINNPELTAERFCRERKLRSSSRKPVGKGIPSQPPGKNIFSSFTVINLHGAMFYKTGDLVRWLPEGDIEFLGRCDFQVKVRGNRIELGEIESQLLQYPGIKEAVVLAREITAISKTGNTSVKHDEVYLCAYIVANKDIHGSELRTYLDRELPHYMIPAHFIKIKNIPLNPNGKLDKKALDRYGSQLRPEVEFVPPRHKDEKILAQIWQEILQAEQVGIHDNFFELGGNSLKIIELTGRINETFATDIPVVIMFRFPTINALVQYLHKEEKTLRSRKKDLNQGKLDRQALLKRREGIKHG